MSRIFNVVEYPNETTNEVVHRFPEVGYAEYRIGTTLIVNNNQALVFCCDGLVFEVLGSGHHTINSSNFSSLINYLGDRFDPQKPFPAEVYFIFINTFHNRSWSTSESILVGTPDSGRAFIQISGKYAFRINSPQLFLEQYRSDYHIRTSQIEERIRDTVIPKIQEAITDICSELKAPLLDIISFHKNEISERVLEKTKEELGSFGTSLTMISITNFNIDKNTSELLKAWKFSENQKVLEEIDLKFVFVIMSFQADMEPVFLGIENAAKSVGLVAKRVKDIPGDYRITDQIIQMIHKARFVVVDLTHERPNVYFELGYARGLGKTVVTIAREGTNVHFDIKDWTYISYTDSRFLEHDLEKRFEFEVSKDSPKGH